MESLLYFPPKIMDLPTLAELIKDYMMHLSSANEEYEGKAIAITCLIYILQGKFIRELSSSKSGSPYKDKYLPMI